jgi:hypothetical protein
MYFPSLLFVLAATSFAADPKVATEDQKMEGLVQAIKVLPDKAPDCSSLKAIVASVTRGCRTNDAPAASFRARWGYARAGHGAVVSTAVSVSSDASMRRSMGRMALA